jgi:hypothetical protein
MAHLLYKTVRYTVDGGFWVFCNAAEYGPGMVSKIFYGVGSWTKHNFFTKLMSPVNISSGGDIELWNDFLRGMVPVLKNDKVIHENIPPPLLKLMDSYKHSEHDKYGHDGISDADAFRAVFSSMKYDNTGYRVAHTAEKIGEILDFFGWIFSICGPLPAEWARYYFQENIDDAIDYVFAEARYSPPAEVEGYDVAIEKDYLDGYSACFNHDT